MTHNEDRPGPVDRGGSGFHNLENNPDRRGDLLPAWLDLVSFIFMGTLFSLTDNRRTLLLQSLTSTGELSP